MATTKHKARRAAKPTTAKGRREAFGSGKLLPAHARAVVAHRGSTVHREMWITKAASTIGGGVSAGLAAAILVPSAPFVAGIATVAGLIGSGLWIAKHG